MKRFIGISELKLQRKEMQEITGGGDPTGIQVKYGVLKYGIFPLYGVKYGIQPLYGIIKPADKDSAAD